MWLKILRSRPVHMAAVSGISVYVLLTIVGMLMHENEHTSTSSRQRYSANQIQLEDGGIVQLNNRDLFNPNLAKDPFGDENLNGHKREALVAAPADDTNFIYLGKQPQGEGAGDSDRLNHIANLLENIQAKMDKNDPDKEQGMNADLKDVQNAIKGLIGGEDKKVEHRTEKSSRVVLEEPDEKEALEAVGIDELAFVNEPSQSLSHCPKTVQTLAKYSKWFSTRYEHGIKLFTDFEDIRNYKNYHKLEHYTPPFGFKRTKRQQFADIMNHPNFTNSPLFNDGERPRCLRCAVVGCGGILNGSNAGEEIDSHDLVFRLNRAMSSGRFAQDVGVKTSLYTFFPESMHAQDVIDENAMYIYTIFKQYDVDYMESIIKNQSPPIYVQKGKKYKLKKPPIPADRLKLLHPDFSRYVFTRFLDGKSHRPTTGALVVMLAVHICDEVTIYGFGYDTRFTLHYYDKAFVSHTDKSTALHDVDNERGLWNKLHEEGVIRFFKRDL